MNKVMRVLHSYTSMAMLLIMLFFTVTGITLNHRDWFSSVDEPIRQRFELPTPFQDETAWEESPIEQGNRVRLWLKDEYSVLGNKVSFEWEADERLMVIDVKRPGGYSLAEIDLDAAEVFLEKQSYGTVAVLNDLHMGRYSGVLWSLFIDLSAVAMLLFTLTGFWLVLPQKKRRKNLISMSLVGTGVMAGAYFWVILG